MKAQARITANLEVNMDALGIDVSKATFDVAIEVNGSLYEAQFTNDEAGYKKLANWLKERKVDRVHACLEATGRYGERLAEWLHQAGHRVSVVNPIRIKRYAQSQLRRNKSDRLDAQLIRDFCVRQTPDEWRPPPPERQELQALVRHLTALQKMRQQEVNRLKSGVPSAVVLTAIESHIAFIDQQIEQLQQQIKEHIAAHPSLTEQRNLLVTIPGIADLTAARLLAEIPDIHVFTDGRQLAAYAGLTPAQHRSGTSVNRRGSLSKVGNATLRTHLYMSAMVACYRNPVIVELRLRLQERGKHMMCIIGAAMRKLLHIVYGVLKNGKPFDPNHAAQFRFST